MARTSSIRRAPEAMTRSIVTAAACSTAADTSEEAAGRVSACARLAVALPDAGNRRWTWSVSSLYGYDDLAIARLDVALQVEDLLQVPSASWPSEIGTVSDGPSAWPASGSGRCRRATPVRVRTGGWRSSLSRMAADPASARLILDRAHTRGAARVEDVDGAGADARCRHDACHPRVISCMSRWPDVCRRILSWWSWADYPAKPPLCPASVSTCRAPVGHLGRRGAPPRVLTQKHGEGDASRITAV